MENVVNRRSSERHPNFLEDGRVVTDVDVINGCYRLSWRERICFCSGDLAQNLIYQTVSIWLLFYYNNVFGLDSATVAVMFLVVRIIDVVWDPMVGAIVDKSHPRWGKYRSWLILGAVLLATFATLCFWNGFSGSLLYAYVTYVGMSMSFTFVNVPYAALGSSLTRDTDEITILTSVRMVMANLAGLIIKTLPLVIVLFAPKVLNPQTGEMEAVYNTPEAGGTWFITMSIFALVGLVLLLVTFFESKERIVMDKSESALVKVSDDVPHHDCREPQEHHRPDFRGAVRKEYGRGGSYRLYVGTRARGGDIQRVCVGPSCGRYSECTHLYLHEGRHGAWRRHPRTGACLGGLQGGRVGADADGRAGHPLARHPHSCRPVRIGHFRDWQV